MDKIISMIDFSKDADEKEWPRSVLKEDDEDDWDDDDDDDDD